MRKLNFVLFGLVVMVGWSLLWWPIGAAAAEYRNPMVSNAGSADYWLDRGAMLSTYGNHSAAIQAYHKAMSLDPNQSATYYDLGVAYGESGQLGQALAAMDRALSLEPGNGRYLYGRAWVLLRSGKSQEARTEFEKAAQAGDQDAQLYLERQLSKP